MIERNHIHYGDYCTKDYVLSCDCCDDSEYFDTFDEALQYANDNGWKITNEDNDWEHICPDCQEGEE